jgi:hypothetical protein
MPCFSMLFAFVISVVLVSGGRTCHRIPSAPTCAFDDVTSSSERTGWQPDPQHPYAPTLQKMPDVRFNGNGDPTWHTWSKPNFTQPVYACKDQKCVPCPGAFRFFSEQCFHKREREMGGVQWTSYCTYPSGNYKTTLLSHLLTCHVSHLLLATQGLPSAAERLT